MGLESGLREFGREFMKEIKHVRAALVACATMVPASSFGIPIAYDSFEGTVVNFNDLQGAYEFGAGEQLGNQYAALGVSFSVPNYGAYASTRIENESSMNSDPVSIWVDQAAGGQSNARGITIDFASAQSSVGLFLFGSTTSTFTLEVYNGDTLLESLTSGFQEGAFYPQGYLALSNENITRAVVYSTSYWTGYPGLYGLNWNFHLDDLKFSGPSASVPEPGSLALLASALLGLAATRRRRIRG
jgi:hypothetical protein